jgi:enoyl-CoA hydratase/carnithine racemase
VDVVVDEARHDGAAFQLDDASRRADPWVDLGIGANRHDSIANYGNRLGYFVGLIDGVYLTAAEHDVGRLTERHHAIVSHRGRLAALFAAGNSSKLAAIVAELAPHVTRADATEVGYRRSGVINDTVLLEKRGKVAIVTLNRADAGNAHNGQMGEALDATWAHLQKDDDTWAVVLTGAGNRHFCTGADMRAAVQQHQPGFTGRGVTPWGDIPENFWKPVICAINGVVAGGGWHFFWQSDFSIAVDDATFLEPHVSVGWVPLREMLGMATKAPLPIVARMALLGTKERLTAQRAYELGIVTELVSREQLMPRAIELAQAICEQAPLAVRATKEALVRAHDLRYTTRDLYAHMDVVRQYVDHDSDDGKEGPRAFSQKRPANWQGK